MIHVSYPNLRLAGKRIEFTISMETIRFQFTSKCETNAELHFVILNYIDVVDFKMLVINLLMLVTDSLY